MTLYSSPRFRWLHTRSACSLSVSSTPLSLGLGLVLGFLIGLESPAAADTRPDPNMPYPAPSPRVLRTPERAYTYTEPLVYPSLLWIGAQLLPSPEVAVGRVRELDATGQSELATKASFGLRWQVSPILWSWGVNRRTSRWRFFVVDPLARHSGSLELSASFEYFWGDVDRAIVRPGVRAYFPLAQRGEYLSASIGTSTYLFDGEARVAYEVGVYAFSGLFGVQATVAPDNGPLMTIGTFRIRYF